METLLTGKKHRRGGFAVTKQEGLKVQFDREMLATYCRDVIPTDMLPQDNLQPVILGLFGEVGSVMAGAKKQRREGEAYPEHRDAAEEEFGDVLWYFVTLCRRLRVDANTIFAKAVERTGKEASTIGEAQTLTDLGKAAAALLDVECGDEQTECLLSGFAERYLLSLHASKLALPTVVFKNTEKVHGRFVEPDMSSLPTFDDCFPDEERLPWHFEIKIMQRRSGQCHMQWNGVFVGEPLLDNIAEPDGYRFHDVFHLAHAAILHWSPTFRALIKQKRKSDPSVDRDQDGGRAVVIEEGLTAWTFSRAKKLNFFEGQDSVSFDMLKSLRQFVRGYEVEQCPLRLWERAILQGYAVFRQVRDNQGGIIIGDRETRSIEYKPS